MKSKNPKYKTLNGIGSCRHYCNEPQLSSAEREYPQYIGKEVVSVEWSTGGIMGGSCWENSHPEPYTSDEKEPPFEALDALLQELRPNLTFLEFRKLERECVHEHKYTQNEYYGNCTYYSVKFVVVEEVKKFIESLG